MPGPRFSVFTAMLGAALHFFPLIGWAQLSPATPPIANPADKRFENVREDWTTPALDSSHLQAAEPLTGYINKYPGYTVELLQLQWRFGDPLDVYVMKPTGVLRPPVILYLYSFPEDTDRFKNEQFQRGVTENGFAAVGFVSALTGHRYHDRPMKEWFISELQESLATSAHDVQMVLNYLGNRGDLDISRVGMFATGSGATISILSSAVDPRIKVLDAVYPWGDWPDWMATSPLIPEDERPDYLKPEYLKRIAGLDPLHWLPRIRARKFRLQSSEFDKTTPRIAKRKLRAAVPAGAEVLTYDTVAQFKKIVVAGMELDWIKRQVRSLPASSE